MFIYWTLFICNFSRLSYTTCLLYIPNVLRNIRNSLHNNDYIKNSFRIFMLRSLHKMISSSSLYLIMQSKQFKCRSYTCSFTNYVDSYVPYRDFKMFIMHETHHLTHFRVHMNQAYTRVNFTRVSSCLKVSTFLDRVQQIQTFARYNCVNWKIQNYFFLSLIYLFIFLNFSI